MDMILVAIIATFLLFLGLLGSLFMIEKIVKNKKFVCIELLLTALFLVTTTYLSGLLTFQYPTVSAVGRP
jgi:hypothetical protein